MAKTCPSCGTRAVDDQSLFCNKCGYPFPKTRPEHATIVQRGDTRLYQPPVEDVSPPRPVARAIPVRGPAQKKTGGGGKPLPFRRFISRDYAKIIYLLGALAIIILSVLGILGSMPKTGTESAGLSAFANTTALVQTPSTTPLFWIGFLIFGSLIWRMFCEMAAVVVRIHDAPGSHEADPGEADYDDGDAGYSADGSGDYVECPHCGKVVPAGDLRECEHCGIQGCSNCVRKMGLIRKTMTCKDCFESK